MSELDDAIIEDAIHCDLCGAAWVCGGHENGVCVQAPVSDFQSSAKLAQLKLCIDCAMLVSLTLEHNLKERDICEHGVCAGDWCEPCNKAYKQARLENGDE